MQIKNIAVAVLCFLATGSLAQVKPLSWNNQPKLHKVPDQYAGESAVFIQEKRQVEYRQESKDVYVYRTVHRIIKVLDDNGIEAFNRMSVASGGGRKIEHIQARSILPGGKVYEVNMDEIKETKSEEGVPQLIFALKGLERGAEVELLYIEKRSVSLFGTERFQFAIPVLNASFTIACPKRLMFETKGYNGFPDATDTLKDGTRFYQADARNIPALKEEIYSNHEAYLQRIDYRVGYLPDEKPNIRQFTWNDLARELYNQYEVYTDKERKVVAKYLKAIGVEPADAEEQKIRKIENSIKSEITVKDDLTDPLANDLDRIIEKKLATESGQARLMAACFTIAGVPYEIGMTTNRYEYLLDEQFENWRNLQDYLFYLPRQKKFIYPTGNGYRMPLLPSSMLGNKGVFAKVTTVGTLTSATMVIRNIDPLPASASDHSLDVSIRFSPELVPEVALTQSFTGYSAIGIRDAFVYVSKEQERDLVVRLLDIVQKPEDILSYKIKGKAFANYYEEKPLLLTAEVRTPALMERAGAKYLFKIGSVIGRQAEMYQEDKRKLPVDIQYPHALTRTIRINLPEGYRLKNPEDLIINKMFKDGQDKQTMAFTSAYKLEGRLLVVNILEIYKNIHYPASEIENFREVINAAADFNKIVLVFEKE